MHRTLAAATLFAALPASAHDLYLRLSTYQPKPGATIRVAYHNGDAFPKSQGPVKIERLRDSPLRNLRAEGVETVGEFTAPAQPGTFAIVTRTLPNFIELAPEKFEGYLKHEELQHVIAWRKQHGESAKPGRELYSKYVKALAYAGAPSADFAKPAGLKIEFVPLNDPYGLKPGEPLRVRVLFDGKPSPGLAVEASRAYAGKVSHAHPGRTDAQGEIAIPIAGPGLWKLHAIRMDRRADTKEADWESFWASLTFETR